MDMKEMKELLKYMKKNEKGSEELWQ